MNAKPERTKIVATLGPASSSPETIGKLIDLGVDVFRCNFSHGSAEQHTRDIETVRRVAAERRKIVAILQDLQGIKLRTTDTVGGPIELQPGSSILVEGSRDMTTAERICIAPEAALDELKAGDAILLNDGRFRLQATKREGSAWRAEVIYGGELTSRKGVHLPDTPMRTLPSLTAKDLRDLEVGVRAGVDLVALSFVRSAHDVRVARDSLTALGADIPIIAKIEKPEALTEIPSILAESFGVMVARGDLGVELTPERVPVVQKRIIAEARAAKKPVITATQMLESMIDSPVPTRAEASDIANAVYDGTDAIMLSAETAVGHYPAECVEIASRILCEVETELRRDHQAPTVQNSTFDVAESTAVAASTAAESIGARAIVVFTKSGSTARWLAALRPRVPIRVLGCEPATLRRLAVVWGLEIYVDERTPKTLEELFTDCEDALRQEAGWRHEGREIGTNEGTIVVVAGLPLDQGGTTNLIKIHHLTSEQ